MRSNYEERLHFLAYAYFGIDDKDDKWFELLFGYDNPNATVPRELIERVSLKAYGDLCRNIPYIMNYNQMNRPGNRLILNMKQDFKDSVIELLSDRLQNFNTHNADISELINEVSLLGVNYPDLFVDGNRFTIGLAQKWVNMTLKYLWILGAVDGENLHAPIDRNIIIAATRAPSNNNLCLGINFDYHNNVMSNWPSWDDIDEYNDFQSRIREQSRVRRNYYPITWENEAWIEIAKHSLTNC